MLLLLVLLVPLAQIHGSCPPPTKDPCLLNGFSYTHMCNCATRPPTYCFSNQSCSACQFQGGTCSVASNAPPCCPLLSGQSYCNPRTKKCEAIRYCTEDGENCPFNDLTADEITRTADLIKASNMYSSPQLISFPVIRTLEPTKQEWINGLDFKTKRAYVQVLDLTSNVVSEVIVDLVNMSVSKKVEIPLVVPLTTIHELVTGGQLGITNPEVQAAFIRRRLNPQKGFILTNTIGASGKTMNLPGKRYLIGVALYPDNNTGFDWRPVEGLQVKIDMNTMTVVEVQDSETYPLTPIPQFLKASPTKNKLKPLIISQPKGTSIEVRGQQIRWYKWRLMYSVDPVYGLQLFHVRYHGDCEERLVLYKISLSEMVVPYGATGPQWRWRRPIDAGEYGMGHSADDQVIGQDVPENALLLNCTQYQHPSGDIEVTEVPGCVALYERDAGLMYRYTSVSTDKSYTQRGREMVLGFYFYVGNYGYLVEYILQQDGVLRLNIRATGALLPRGVNSRANSPYCLDSCTTIVNDYLVAPPHQHLFNYRMDFDINGPFNHLMQIDVTNDPVGPGNPDGGAFSAKKHIIKIESAHDVNVQTSRSWEVVNSHSRNRYNTPRGYKIQPGAVYPKLTPFLNVYLPQTEFISHDFWATKYSAVEQAAAGQYPRTGLPLQGLPRFVENRESLVNTDVVTWYTVGMTHTTRPEEWPIMNVHQTGFSLVPFNFMSQNPEIALEGRCA